MNSRGPVEVIHWRADYVVWMICAVQFFALKLGMAFGQEIAETPSWALVNAGFTRKMSVEACSVPVLVVPISTSASPPPKTRLPGCCSAASITPWKVGVEPKRPGQRFVPDLSPLSPTIPIVPSAAMEISGSLFPSGRNSGVLVKANVPLDLLANAITAAHTTPRIAAINLRILPYFIGFASSQLKSGSTLPDTSVLR